MAHYALLNEQNVVKMIMVIDDSWEINGEQDCIQKCKEFFDAIDPVLYSGTWIKTSYNHNIRKRYAGLGHTYNKDLDAFIPIKPYNSWILNTTTCDWEAPVPKPTDTTKIWKWDEHNEQWIQR